MPIDKPEYRDIPKHSGYRIGSDGSVLGPRGQLSVFLNGNQARVSLGSKGRNTIVSHLVLEAFVGPRQPGQVACHFPDRNPLNCAVENLRWGTDKDNGGDRVKHGTTLLGEKNGQCKIPDAIVEEIRVATGTQREIAKKFGVTQAHVWNLRHTTGIRRSRPEKTCQ